MICKHDTLHDKFLSCSATFFLLSTGSKVNTAFWLAGLRH
jgi:hypothetical protein